MKAWMGGLKRKIGVERKSQAAQQRQYFAQRREGRDNAAARAAQHATRDLPPRYDAVKKRKVPPRRQSHVHTRDATSLNLLARATSGVIDMCPRQRALPASAGEATGADERHEGGHWGAPVTPASREFKGGTDKNSADRDSFADRSAPGSARHRRVPAPPPLDPSGDSDPQVAAQPSAFHAAPRLMGGGGRCPPGVDWHETAAADESPGSRSPAPSGSPSKSPQFSHLQLPHQCVAPLGRAPPPALEPDGFNAAVGELEASFLAAPERNVGLFSRKALRASPATMPANGEAVPAGNAQAPVDPPRPSPPERHGPPSRREDLESVTRRGVPTGAQSAPQERPVAEGRDLCLDRADTFDCPPSSSLCAYTPVYNPIAAAGRSADRRPAQAIIKGHSSEIAPRINGSLLPSIHEMIRGADEIR